MMDTPTFSVFPSFIHPISFNPNTNQISFERIEASWLITDPGLFDYYWITMYLGDYHNKIDFYSGEAILDYQNTYHNTWYFYSPDAWVNDSSEKKIKLTPSEWNECVTYSTF